MPEQLTPEGLARSLARNGYEVPVRVLANAMERGGSRPLPKDGRPCETDLFASALVYHNDNCYEVVEAIRHWTEGDWDSAMAYLPEEAAEKLEVDE